MSEEKKTMQAVELKTLMQAVAEYYSEDETTAWLVMAWLPDQASYYISVCRYKDAFGAGKQVVACTTAACLEKAVSQVIVIWLKNICKDETKSLEKLIAESALSEKQS